jgi:hypothetical protein
MVGILQVVHRITQYVLCQVQVKKLLFQAIVVFSKYGSCFASRMCEAQVLVCWGFTCCMYAKYCTSKESTTCL